MTSLLTQGSAWLYKLRSYQLSCHLMSACVSMEVPVVSVLCPSFRAAWASAILMSLWLRARSSRDFRKFDHSRSLLPWMRMSLSAGSVGLPTIAVLRFRLSRGCA